MTIHENLSTARPATGAAKVVVSGVSRVFEGRKQAVQALGDVDLTIGDGEFVCLVGPSGCGKSTLLRMMAGLLRPSSGFVEVRPRHSDRPPVAMVFQDYSIYPWMTVLANVRFGLDVAGVKRKEADARSMHWLRKLGLDDFADAYPATLSGGMRQRVSIARALAVEPEVLLMDEPFAALDAQLRTILQDELLALWQEDRRTVVFVTHSLEEAILLGDRVVVMSSRPGRIVGTYPVPFERPRSGALRSTGEFAEFQGVIWDQLRDEVNRSLHP
jgi:NitT/TauT family transport system ATP-binding protein